MAKLMKIAAVQLELKECWDEIAFYDLMEEQVREAADKGAEIVAFPEDIGFCLTFAKECFRVKSIRNGVTFEKMSFKAGLFGWLDKISDWILKRIHLNFIGEWLSQSKISNIMHRTFGSLAAQYNIAIIAGSTYARKKDGIYNVSRVYDKDGTLAGEYCKYNLVTIEKAWGVKPGPEPTAIRLKDHTIGVCLCYDLNDPVPTNNMVFNGAEIIFAPSGGWRPYPGYPYSPEKDMPQILRAKENGVAIVRPYCCGTLMPGAYFEGHTSIVGPDGEIIELAASPDKHQVICRELPLKAKGV